MRKLGIAVVIILLLIVVAVAALPYVVDVNKYHGRIQAELQKRTGRPVSLGQMNLKVFPLAFRVDNAVIGEDPAVGGTRPFVEVKELLVSAQLMPLLRGDVQVDSVELRQPRIELVRAANGAWNFSSLGKTNTTTAGDGKGFSLGLLKIVDGQVAITDVQKQQPRSLYDHIDLTLKDYAPSRPVTLQLAAHLPGQGNQSIELNGKGGPFNGSNLLASDFSGELKLDQVSLSGIQKFLNSSALQGMEFTASGATSLRNQAGQLSSKGNLTLADGRVNGVNIGYPVAADYDINADMNHDTLTINKGLLKLGSTPLTVQGSVNFGPTPMQLDLKMTAANASISDAARLASAFGVAFNPGMVINGRLDADISAKGSSTSPMLNGRLSTKELVITGKQLQQAVQVTNVDLALSPASIRSNEFVATTGSTAVNLNFALNNYAQPNSTIDATLRANNAQLGELIRIGQAYGVEALDGMDGSGPVTLNLRVQGPTKDPAGLVYSGTGSLQNASLTVPSLTKPVQIRSAALRFDKNSAVLDNLTATVGSTNATGQLTLKGLAPKATPQAQFSLSADRFDVNEWQALMRNQPVPAPARRASLQLVPTAYAQTPAAEAPLLHRLTGNGNVSVGTVLYDKMVLSNAKSAVTLDHGLIRMAPFTANLYGGVQSGSVVIDTRPTPSTYTVSSKLDHVDANQLLSATSSLDKVLYGLLAANANTSFVSSASTDTAKTLNGNVTLNLQNGKIAGVDLLNQLASIGKFLQGSKPAEPFTNIFKLVGDFKITNGVARTDNLNAVIDGGSLAAQGLVNLANQSLDMQVTAVLSKEFSQTVGGTQVGGYLSTALANNKGELVMPVLITGSFASPKITPDFQRIAKMKLENLLPSANNPGALSSGILDAVLGNKNQNADASGKKPGGLQGVLDAIGGKNQQQPAANQPPAQQDPNAKPDPDSDQLPDPSHPKGTAAPSGSQPQQSQQPAQGQDSISDIVNSVMGKKKQTPPPPPPQTQPEPKKDEPPKR